MYSFHEQILSYLLESQETDLYNNEKEFQWVQSDFATYIKETTNWQRMELGWIHVDLSSYCICHTFVLLS